MKNKTYFIILFIINYYNTLNTQGLANGYLKEQKKELDNQINNVDSEIKNLQSKKVDDNKKFNDDLTKKYAQFDENEKSILNEIAMVLKKDLLEHLEKKNLMKKFFNKVERYVNMSNKVKQETKKTELLKTVNDKIIEIYNKNYIVNINSIFLKNGIQNSTNQNNLILNNLLQIVKEKLEEKEKLSIKKNIASEELTFLTKKFCNKKNKYDNTICNINVFNFVLKNINYKMKKLNYFKFLNKEQFESKLKNSLKLEFDKINGLKKEYKLFQSDKIKKRKDIQDNINDIELQIKELKKSLKK